MPAVKSLHELIRNAMADVIKADETFLGQRVYVMDSPDPTKIDKPCIVCSYSTVTETVIGGTNERDDIKYPVLVGMYGKGQLNSQSRNVLDPLRFRDRMRMVFHMKRLTAITSVMYCDYNGRPPIYRDDPRFDDLETAVEIAAFARVSRSLS